MNKLLHRLSWVAGATLLLSACQSDGDDTVAEADTSVDVDAALTADASEADAMAMDAATGAEATAMDPAAGADATMSDMSEANAMADTMTEVTTTETTPPSATGTTPYP